MTRLAKIVLPALALAGLSAPAVACDFHGGGGGGFFGGDWQSYNPRVSMTDPALLGGLDGGEVDGLETTLPALKAPKRPTFSTVASRASQSALARRAKTKAAGAKTAEAKTSGAKAPAGASDTDGQAVRD